MPVDPFQNILELEEAIMQAADRRFDGMSRQEILDELERLKQGPEEMLSVLAELKNYLG